MVGPSFGSSPRHAVPYGVRGYPTPVASSIFEPRYERFLKRLRAARKAAGLTQLEVSRQLKRPSNFCHRLECGERRVQAIDLADLSVLYGIPMRSFFPETPADKE